MTEGEPGLDLLILGPPQVVVTGAAIDVAGRHQQVILLLLVLNRGRTVTTSRLIDAMWGPTPPPSAAASLRMSVSKLRRVLRGAPGPEVLLTAFGGYSLDVTAEQTDVGRFEQALGAARTAAGPDERWRHLDGAVRMWHGSPGPAPEYDADVTTELARLVELRDLALEDRADAALAMGRGRELVPELEALVAQAPLRERRTALLMTALSNAGRQADALAAYRLLRARLVDELGLEPSAELRAVERAVLSQAGTAPTAPPPPPTAAPRADRPRRWWARRAAAAAAAGVVTVAVMAALMAVAWPADDPEPDPPIGVARLHPETGDVVGELRVLSRTRVGTGFGPLVLDERAVWLRNDLDETVSRVERDSGLVTHTVPVGASGGDITIAGGDVWVANAGDNTVTRVDGRSGKVVATIAVGLAPQGITSADGDVWVGIHRGEPSGSVWRIDVDTNEVVARIPVGARQFRAGPSWLAAGAGSVWVGVPNLSAVVRIDPRTETVTATIPVPDGGVCGRLSVDDDAVWVASGLCGDGALTRIDPSTNRVVARITSRRWNSVFTQTTGFGSVWLATDAGPFEVDPQTDEVVGRLALAGDLGFGGDIATGEGSLWIHDAKNQSLLRLRAPRQ